MDDPQRTTRAAAGPSLLVAVLATSLAAVAANLAGALWAQLEPQT